MEMSRTENGVAQSGTVVLTTDQYRLKIFQTSLNLLANVLIGIVVGASLLFAFRNGLPLGATPLHIVLCVIGYQLLMAHAILSMSPNNGWSAHLKVVDKRRAHWVLQILGSALAIAGSFIKILDKSVHWNTFHGQFALVALVFTTVSLVNGVASLWAYELRGCIPARLSKVTHICFGIVGFAAAGITLCYGMEKGSFRGWSGDGMGYTLIAFVSCMTFIIIIDPFISLITKIKSN